MCSGPAAVFFHVGEFGARGQVHDRQGQVVGRLHQAAQLLEVVRLGDLEADRQPVGLEHVGRAGLTVQDYDGDRAQGLVVTRQGAGAFVAPDIESRPFRLAFDGLPSIAEAMKVCYLFILMMICRSSLSVGLHIMCHASKIIMVTHEILHEGCCIHRSHEHCMIRYKIVSRFSDPAEPSKARCSLT